MFAALVKGMLSSEQENMEDLLTSSVFGAFQYGNASEGLICFLKKSKPMYGDIPLGHDMGKLQIHFDDYDFWPLWAGMAGVDNCEPDLLIEIHSSASINILVLIEAKFNSGKSAFPTKDGNVSDQLAKEWLHLYRQAQKRSCIPWLIYLTADTATPKHDIEESKEELVAKLGPSDQLRQLNISWLSWRHLSYLYKQSDVHQLSQLGLLANRLNLAFYKGMGKFNQLTEFNYRFMRKPYIRFNWNFELKPASEWEFYQ